MWRDSRDPAPAPAEAATAAVSDSDNAVTSESDSEPEDALAGQRVKEDHEQQRADQACIQTPGVNLSYF